MTNFVVNTRKYRRQEKQLLFFQKQPSEVLYKKLALKNFAKFTGKHPCQSLFFKKTKLEISVCNFNKNRDSGMGVFMWILQDLQLFVFCRIHPGWLLQYFHFHFAKSKLQYSHSCFWTFFKLFFTWLLGHGCLLKKRPNMFFIPWK